MEKMRKNDHRRLGKELALFFFHPTAPGMPYWLPKGLVVLHELIAFWRRVHVREGYQEIASPLINDKSLWELSGHWEHYRDEMFVMDQGDGRVFGVKPMNCPNAMLVFNHDRRSYRDLPLRLSDCDVLHRNERSGTRHGLLRVQKFQQDDAHIFLAEDQVKDEIGRVLAIVDRFYRLFGFSYRLRLSTRPREMMGDLESWDKAEVALAEVLADRLGVGGFEVSPGDGAFYGPKIDILIRDALGREWQMGTIQLDFQLPKRFGCHYVGKDGAQKVPVVVHRVIYGSLERFIGILLEHSGGELPAWISPEQARILPVAEAHQERAEEVKRALQDSGVRVTVASDGNLGARIKDAEAEKVPYVLVIGDRELASGSAAVRQRKGGHWPPFSWPELLARLKEEISAPGN